MGPQYSGNEDINRSHRKNQSSVQSLLTKMHHGPINLVEIDTMHSFDTQEESTTMERSVAIGSKTRK